ncbi:DNA-binding GntR family transcriptional regulator [Breoghania corrubedonensis]|uniref:DNA-binding GntR family transcriptional regulator n=1 Tax=Breoghania corrubedonensis TaxID=665038 RepID=A0A2T5V8Z9_9HYPH|nr:GntR family transcriptional regulator [Breoghania corrubedonensis]PTW60211.1 DNA-binding GntR family transcriptional regulator [Breoghania corrubedonensis]
MTASGENVIHQLSEDLRTGVFPPGAWLKQVDLQQRYGVNRAQVRKALETLAGRRVVRYEQNRGYSVHPADNEETDHVLAIRLAIETGFCEAIVKGATSEDVHRLHHFARSFNDMVRRGAYDQLYEMNLRFHRALLVCAGNAAMVNLVDELRLRTSPAPASQWRNLARIERSAAEHIAMAEALEQRDAERLLRLIRVHIEQKPDPAV